MAEKKARENKAAYSNNNKSSKSSVPAVTAANSSPRSCTSGSNKRSALDELIAEEEMYKEKRNRKDYWMTVGIEVKLIYPRLPKNILYRHAVVGDMEDNYTVSGVVRRYCLNF